MKVTRKAFIALLFAACTSALSAQIIQIKVLDGKTGRPVNKVCVGVWSTAPGIGDVYVRTDKSGVALLSFTKKDSEVNIPINLNLLCGPTGSVNPVVKYEDPLMFYTTIGNPTCAVSESVPNGRSEHAGSISTNDVFQHGFVSANTCGSITATPQPGVVVLFVRPRNHQERIEDCRAGEFPIVCW